MYNRYIPQSDGTYRRNRMQDSPPQQSIPRREQPVPCPPQEKPGCQESSPPPCQPQPRPKPVRPSCPHRNEPSETSVLSFLRQLLPRDFDTSDLLVVILLLLMSSDCAEDQNSALLTLVLYLFL